MYSSVWRLGEFWTDLSSPRWDLSQAAALRSAVRGVERERSMCGPGARLLCARLRSCHATCSVLCCILSSGEQAAAAQAAAEQTAARCALCPAPRAGLPRCELSTLLRAALQRPVLHRICRRVLGCALSCKCGRTQGCRRVRRAHGCLARGWPPRTQLMRTSAAERSAARPSAHFTSPYPLCPHRRHVRPRE